MSKTLQTMYREAQSSGNLDPLQRTSVIESGLEMVPSHVSRVDAYWTVQNALGRAVCRYVHVRTFVCEHIRMYTSNKTFILE